jgi:hypothetical protein
MRGSMALISEINWMQFLKESWNVLKYDINDTRFVVNAAEK